MSALDELDAQIASLTGACESGARELAALREEARGRWFCGDCGDPLQS